MQCVFCGIVAGQVESDVLYQDEEITVFRDIRPQAPTHVLIVPNRHVSSVEQLFDGDSPLLVKMLSKAHEVAEAAGIADRGVPPGHQHQSRGGTGHRTPAPASAWWQEYEA